MICSDESAVKDEPLEDQNGRIQSGGAQICSGLFLGFEATVCDGPTGAGYKPHGRSAMRTGALRPNDRPAEAVQVRR